MKATDWINTAKLTKERQSKVATADTSELSSFPLSELSVDESGPPTVLQGPYVFLSTSTPIQVPMHYPVSCNVLCFNVMLATALPHSTFT